MPTTYKRKRNLTFKNAKRSKINPAAVARKAVQMFPGLVRTSRNYLRSTNNPTLLPEKKYFDISQVNSTTTQLLPLGNLVKVAQGTSSNNRIGSKITVNNLNFKFTLVKPATYTEGSITSNPSTVVCRIIVFRDKQMNGTFPGVLDLLAPTTGISGVQAFRNMDTIDRFDFLYDKVHTLVSPTTHPSIEAYTEVTKFVKIAKKMKDVVNYGGTTGVDSELRNIGYGVFIVLDHGHLIVQCQSRVKYYDA